MRLIGLFGGTFDPIHYGHLSVAAFACMRLDLSELRFIPLNTPPHRPTPISSIKHRVAMIEHMIAEHTASKTETTQHSSTQTSTNITDALQQQASKFKIERYEINRNVVSYTIDTLAYLRACHHQASLCFIMGYDSYRHINTWHHWDQLLNYVHLIVADRSSEECYEINASIKSWVKNKLIDNPQMLSEKTHGHVYFLHNPIRNISSSWIRSQLQQGLETQDVLSASTCGYIKNHLLYHNHPITTPTLAN